MAAVDSSKVIDPIPRIDGRIVVTVAQFAESTGRTQSMARHYLEMLTSMCMAERRVYGYKPAEFTLLDEPSAAPVRIVVTTQDRSSTPDSVRPGLTEAEQQIVDRLREVPSTIRALFKDLNLTSGPYANSVMVRLQQKGWVRHVPLSHPKLWVVI